MPKAILWVDVLAGLGDPMTFYQLTHTLGASSDPDNPGPEEMSRIIEETRTIAVVGLSRDPVKAARRVPSYMAAKGYDVIPVNPHAERLLGRVSYASLDDVPPSIDMVLVFRSSAEAGPIVEQAMEREEEPAIWLTTGVTSPDEVAAARCAGRNVIQDLSIFRVHLVLLD